MKNTNSSSNKTENNVKDQNIDNTVNKKNSNVKSQNTDSGIKKTNSNIKNMDDTTNKIDISKSKTKKARSTKKKKRKINYQKIFNFVSFIFIMVCIFWYGGRFVYYYLDSKETDVVEANSISLQLITANKDKETFRQVDNSYYFYEKADNNYVSYSNILWRIIKINEDGSVSLIADSVVGALAYGEEAVYQNSPVIRWLNAGDSNYSGIFENILHKKENYLIKNTTCIDSISDVNNLTCNEKNSDYYLGLLSIEDYANTGGKNSFINNERYTYLANQNAENQVWYLTQEGTLDTTDGDDVFGIRPVITLSPTLIFTSGTGTSTDPYRFSDENAFIGSYVKLGEDIWRVYEEKDGIVKLRLNDYLKVDNEVLQYAYSNNTYYHNDTKNGSLAYYLNKTYLNSLSYKDLVVENLYTNGYYGEESGYDYTSILEKTIKTKVSVPSMGEIIWNETIENYFTSTGASSTSSLVYVMKGLGAVTRKNVNSESSVVPCISILRDVLKVGTGSLEDPYRTE